MVTRLCLLKMENEDGPKEEDRTLTDHLNKKLLQSFLARLEDGSMQFPAGDEEQNGEEEWEDKD